MSRQGRRLKRTSSTSSTNGPQRKIQRTKSFSQEIELILSKPSGDKKGSVLVFGDGVAGQLGLGEDVTEKSRPAPVAGLDNIIDICAGGMHTVCLTSDYKVITFGCNDEGALGRDTSEEGSEYTPGLVDIPGDVVQISAGDCHTAALLEDGTVYVWGSFRDSHGPMGLLNVKMEKSPVMVSTVIKMVRIASGSHHLILLSNNGNLYTCGCGEQGQLGRVSERGSTRDTRRGIVDLLRPSMIPFNPRSKTHFEDVWAGSFCSFAKEKAKGEIFVFGLNNYRQIGLDMDGVHYWPEVAPTFSDIKWSKISGGEHHTVALDVNGKVYTMGRKEYGRLGLGEGSEDAASPTLVPTLKDVKCMDVDCGSFATFAITQNGKLMSWGMGSAQLGLGEESDVFVPTEVKGKHLEDKRVVRVSSGGQHTVILVRPDP